MGQRTKDDVPLNLKQSNKPLPTELDDKDTIGGFQPEKESKIDPKTPDTQIVQPKQSKGK